MIRKGLVSPPSFLASLGPNVCGLIPFHASRAPHSAPAQLWEVIQGRLCLGREVEGVTLRLPGLLLLLTSLLVFKPAFEGKDLWASIWGVKHLGSPPAHSQGGSLRPSSVRPQRRYPAPPALGSVACA